MAKHFIVKVKRPIANKIDDVAGKPKTALKSTPKPKAKKPKGPAHTPPKIPRQPTKRDLLRARGFDYYMFTQDIAMFDEWCSLLAEFGRGRPNAVFTELIKADIDRMRIQKADAENRGNNQEKN